MILEQEVTVVSRKFDLSVRRRWKCGLISQKNDLLVFVGTFAETVNHSDLGLISKGTVSFEYYWLNRWYNVFRFDGPDGTFRNYYCNIAMPPKFDGATLDYVDLDIDLIVWPGGEAVTLDEDDFTANAAKYSYPDDIRERALETVTELKRMIAAREFPFENL